jgi:hypothetical protein
VRFFGEANGDGWHFKTSSQSGGAGISASEGFSLNDVGSHLLTELLTNVQTTRQDMTFTTADGVLETLVSHDGGMLAKALMADLHADYFIIR